MEPQRLRNTTYHGISTYDNSRVHAGDVYHFRDADSQRRRFIEWLRPLDQHRKHKSALEQHFPGTLKWFLKDPRFVEWRDAQDRAGERVLWCRGNIGTGKTTLVAQVLEHLVLRGHRRDGIAVVYCRYSELRSHTAESVMASILTQLFRRDKGGLGVPQMLEDEYGKLSDDQRDGPGLEQLVLWLSTTINTRSSVFVLLELDTAQRTRLLEALPTSIKLLVSSLPGIEHALTGSLVIDIHADYDDIRVVVSARLRCQQNRTMVRRSRTWRWLPPYFQTEVISSLVESSHGM
jgi:hypothetical protein